MLTRKTGYAIRALCQLAKAPAESRLAAEIAAAESIPKRFLESILRQLTQHGILSVRRGRQGGYTLQLPPERISVRMVIAAVDGSLFGYPCLDMQRPTRCPECPGRGPCGARMGLGQMLLAANDALRRTTIAEIAAGHQSLGSWETAAGSDL